MKTNIKAYELIEKGLSSKTVSKLTESQIEILHSKLLGEAVTLTNTPSFNIPTADAEKGVTLPATAVPAGKKITIQKTPTGIKATATEEVTEDDEIEKDPFQQTTTQDPKQTGPGEYMTDPKTDKEMDDEDADGMGMFEEKKRKVNPWAVCTAQLGKEFGTRERHLWSAKEKNKYERCVKDVKQSLKEGKNPISLFLENEIMKIVERNLPPRITKGDLIKYLEEQGPATAPTKPKEKPGTKEKPGPTKPKIRPGKNPHPGEKEAPRAGKQNISPEAAKEKLIKSITSLLKHGK